MKYLVTWAWEMDGHAGSSAIVLPTLELVRSYIDASLKDEDEQDMGKITGSRLMDDNMGYEYWGEWDCGQFSIQIRKFKNFADMIGKELFTRTG